MPRYFFNVYHDRAEPDAEHGNAKLTFFLGVDDSVLSDNGGEFDAAVDLSRQT